MKIPFTWKVTGWFMVGWSAEYQRGDVRPLRYFGEDLVAYRDDSGELHVLSGHCRHLGAHIGHGGKVVGDCVECPFHGWRWGPDGTNRYIPYQPDRPNALSSYGCSRSSSSTAACSSGISPRAKSRSGRCPTSSTSSRSSRPTRSRITSRSRSFHAAPRTTGAAADRRRERARQRALPLVHGATVTPVCLKWRGR